MITFPRIFKPGVVVTVAGQIVQSLGVVPGAIDPRVVFKVKRSMNSTPDSAEVKLYGLAPERRTAMQALFGETGRSVLTIACGFDGITVPLFTGDVRKIRANEREGSDYYVHVWADDGGDTLAEATIPNELTSTLGLTPQQQIDVALACFAAPAMPPSTRIPTVIVPDASVAKAIASYSGPPPFYAAVNVGKAIDLLNEAARTLGVRWWVRDSQLFMARRGLPLDGLAIQLPPDHWLEEPSDGGVGIVRVVTWLDPNLVPGRQLVLIGRVAPGVPETFRAETCEYMGDVDSSTPWAVTAEARRFT